MLSLIQQYTPDQFAAGDDQAVVDAMNADTIEKTSDERHDLSDLAEAYGWPSVTNLQSKLVQAGLQGYVDLLANGVDFTKQSTRNAITNLGTNSTITNAEVQGLLRMGIWNVSPAQEHLRRDFTLEDVATARKEQVQTTLSQEWATAQNEGGINAAVTDGDRAGLVAALRAAADTIEAG